MSGRKKDPTKASLGSTQVEGQGTTIQDTGNRKAASSRRKQKRT